MTRRAILSITIATVLTACGSKPAVDERNASVAEVAEAVRESGAANGTFLRAGQWRVTSVLEDMSIPGMPAEVFIRTGRGTVALYALRPLLDSFNGAFRED